MVIKIRIFIDELDEVIVDPASLFVFVDVSGEVVPMVVLEGFSFVVYFRKNIEMEPEIGQAGNFFDDAVGVLRLEEIVGTAVMTVVEVGITGICIVDGSCQVVARGFL